MSDIESLGLESLAELLSKADNGLPPVQNWHPQQSGLIDIRIRRDGSWWHEGTEITRHELVKLFSGVLRLEEAEFYLVTPVEKLKIQVDDAPFLATGLETLNDDKHGQLLVFTTNVGDRVLLQEEKQLFVEIDPRSGEPSPYLHVRHGLNALVSRSIYYELVELGKLENDHVVVRSLGNLYSLGSILDV